MKEFSVDVSVWATLYIKAADAGDALAKAIAYVGTPERPKWVMLQITDGGEPDGLEFSEVATVHGVTADADAEEV